MCCSLLLALTGASGEDFPFTFTRDGEQLLLWVAPNPSYYFGFQHGTDLNIFTTNKLALGVPGPLFSYTASPSEPRCFLRAEAIDIWSPRDFDGDGIDDLWELQNGLDPMNPADAGLPSAFNPSLTNLEYYRHHFGLTPVTEFYSRETSLFNRAYAISSEVSVFNNGSTGTSIEAISRETTVFNNGLAESGTEVYSRETSVFNQGATGASIEALSRETSVFNYGTPGASTEVLSRETTVFNYGATGASIEALSRETSVFNYGTADASTEVLSRETTVFNYGTPAVAIEAISPEVSVLNTSP